MDRQKALTAFAKGLETLRMRTKYTSREIAHRLNISDAFVSKMRGGAALPSFETLCDLIDLGMRLDEIFGEELAAKLTSDYQVNQAVENPQGSLERAKQFLSDLNGLIKQLEDGHSSI